jgi:hypothetical protein
MDLSSSKLLEQATFHQKTNSILLCLLGLTHYVQNPMSHVEIKQSLMRKRLPHWLSFTLLMNALFFQSYSLYAILISRDYKYVREINELVDIGGAMQVGGAVALFAAAV